MQQIIEKELLLARLHYLDEINKKPGTTRVHPVICEKVKDLIQEGSVVSYMAVESLFNFLAEKLPEDESKADELAQEIVAFIN